MVLYFKKKGMSMTYTTDKRLFELWFESELSIPEILSSESYKTMNEHLSNVCHAPYLEYIYTASVVYENGSMVKIKAVCTPEQLRNFIDTYDGPDYCFAFTCAYLQIPADASYVLWWTARFGYMDIFRDTFDVYFGDCAYAYFVRLNNAMGTDVSSNAKYHLALAV